MKIGIIPGHGGKDMGATNVDDGVYEAELNLKEAHEIKKLFSKNGHEVIIANDAPDWDQRKYVSATMMQHEMNQHDVDFCFVLHHNAAMVDASGWMCFALKKNEDFLSVVEESMKRWLSIPAFANEGARIVDNEWPAARHCIELLKMPAVLLESGFVTSPDDVLWMRSGNAVEEVARAVVESVWNFQGEWLNDASTDMLENAKLEEKKISDHELVPHFVLEGRDMMYVFNGRHFRIKHLFSRPQAIELLRELFKAITDDIQLERGTKK